MTLETRVYVLDEIDHREVFRHCQGLLTQYDSQHREPAQQKSGERQGGTWLAGVETIAPDDPWSLHNEGMQNLPAWLWLHHRAGKAYRSADAAAAHDDDLCDEDCDGSWHSPACWLEVSFDTAYSYRGRDGMGCGDLHAALVAQLGQWLDERGVRWLWKDEYSGDIHSGYVRLIDLVSGGFEASAWFRHTVMPAISNGLGARPAETT